jgi:hypothetical protein
VTEIEYLENDMNKPSCIRSETGGLIKSGECLQPFGPEDSAMFSVPKS